MAENDDSAGIPATDVRYLSDEMRAHINAIALTNEEREQLEALVTESIHAMAAALSGAAAPAAPVYDEMRMWMIQSVMDDLLEDLAHEWPSLPPSVRDAVQRFREAAAVHKAARGGPDASLSAVSLAHAESALQRLTLELERASKQAKTSKAGTEAKAARADERMAALRAAMARVSPAQRRPASRCLEALKRQGWVAPWSDRVAEGRIREVLREPASKTRDFIHVPGGKV